MASKSHPSLNNTSYLGANPSLFPGITHKLLTRLIKRKLGRTQRRVGLNAFHMHASSRMQWANGPDVTIVNCSVQPQAPMCANIHVKMNKSAGRCSLLTVSWWPRGFHAWHKLDNGWHTLIWSTPAPLPQHPQWLADIHRGISPSGTARAPRLQPHANLMRMAAANHPVQSTY